jgi:hypothetical protein
MMMIMMMMMMMIRNGLSDGDDKSLNYDEDGHIESHDIFDDDSRYSAKQMVSSSSRM